MSSWSFSALVDYYEKCPRKYKFKYIDKVKEPPRDETHPAERGNRIHKLSEDWLQRAATPQRLETFPQELAAFARDYADLAYERTVVEEEWAFDKDWDPVAWKSPDAWLRMKLDIHWFDGETVNIVDLKTGKKEGNEIKHQWQKNLYCLGAAYQYPEAKEFKASFWYVDHGIKTESSVVRGDITERWRADWTRRANRMLNDESFKPLASKSNCRWCQYNNVCEYAVEP